MTVDSLLSADRLLQIELDGISLIEASAGTGKTYTITNLYLRHILAGRLCSEILVVSFTNAATDELHHRIRTRLYETMALFTDLKPSKDEFLSLLLEQHEQLDEAAKLLQKRRLQLALRSMDESAISTINGFCQRALKDHALLSNLMFDTEMISDDGEIWQAALKDWWRQASYPLDAKLWPLFHHAIPSLKDLFAWQQQIRSHPNNQIIPEVSRSLAEFEQDWDSLEPLLKEIAQNWSDCAGEIFEILETTKVLSRGKTSPFAKNGLADLHRSIDEYLTGNNLSIVLPELELLSPAQLDHNSTPAKRGQEPKFDHRFFKQVGELTDQLNAIRKGYRVRALTDAFEFSCERVRQVKVQSRKLSFQDQLSLLLQALTAAGGKALADTLRNRFPVAMIDEFQDTDPTQYQIFREIYFNVTDASLTLIGDPKQAIYSFRGGDIFTYIKASNEAGIKRYSLLTNWRSEESLINATNAIFARRDDAFIYQRSIKFAPATAAAKPGNHALQLDQKPTAALSIWRLPLKPDDKTFPVGEIRQRINVALVAEIAALISPGRATLGEHAVESGDIAVLVRNGHEGQALRKALAEAGIGSVTIGKDKVYQSDEADGLHALLEAVAQPSDDRCLRRAKSSCLFNDDYLTLASCFDNDDDWQQWIDQMFVLHDCWIARGFIAMFQQLLDGLKPGMALSRQGFVDRRLTNLLHLGELLQQQSRLKSGMATLLNWFKQQIEDGDHEAAELRLESDEALVKIVTVHKSKGLEYPIVFVPFLWGCRRVDKKATLLRFHDPQHDAVIDLGSDDFENNRNVAEKERLSEDLRVLYVALTRARSKTYLVWGDAGNAKSNGQPKESALGFLLHSKQTAEELDLNPPEAFNKPDLIAAELDEFAGNNPDIEVIQLPEPEASVQHVASIDRPTLELKEFHNYPPLSWRINSFSSLTRDVHQVGQVVGTGVESDPILDFPAGSHVGLLLHEILEYLDFQQDIAGQCERMISDLAPGYGIHNSEHQKVLGHWLQQIIHTEFGPQNLALTALSKKQRLNELKFDFAIDRFEMNQLNQLLQKNTTQTLEPIATSNFRGLVTGIIDLVFEHQGKFYLADYKSNLLGRSLDDYEPEKLQRAMLERRYDLQSLLYSIALHRYLSLRLADYCYDQHFGGAYYLFLRAMRPNCKARYGVHFHRAPKTQIEEVEAILSFSAETRLKR